MESKKINTLYLLARGMYADVKKIQEAYLRYRSGLSFSIPKNMEKVFKSEVFEPYRSIEEFLDGLFEVMGEVVTKFTQLIELSQEYLIKWAVKTLLISLDIARVRAKKISDPYFLDIIEEIIIELKKIG